MQAWGADINYTLWVVANNAVFHVTDSKWRHKFGHA